MQVRPLPCRNSRGLFVRPQVLLVMHRPQEVLHGREKIPETATLPSVRTPANGNRLISTKDGACCSRRPGLYLPSRHVQEARQEHVMPARVLHAAVREAIQGSPCDEAVGGSAFSLALVRFLTHLLSDSGPSSVC